jgi:hypothetical protein
MYEKGLPSFPTVCTQVKRKAISINSELLLG